MEIKSIFLILIIFLISCKNNTGKKVDILDIQNKKDKITSEIKLDTLYKLLEESKVKDTLTFVNQDPFLFFKSGNLFSDNEKSAIIVNCPSSSIYRVQFYSFINNDWRKNDELNDLKVPFKQYEIIFKDYNFDKVKDIYLNSTSSNGISISKGYLLIVNPLTKKFENHLEVKNLNNMFPDNKTKRIITDSIEYVEDKKIIWKLIYKWKDGMLIKTDQKIEMPQA